MPDDVPFYQGYVADRPLVERIFAEQGIQAIMHFAGSIVVPGIGRKAALLLSQQYGRDACADQHRRGSGCEAYPLFLDRRGLWRAGQGAGRGRGSQAADQPLWRVEADDRAMLRGLLGGAGLFNYGALRYFNVAGADPQLRDRARVRARPT